MEVMFPVQRPSRKQILTNGRLPISSSSLINTIQVMVSSLPDTAFLEFIDSLIYSA
jgi:hypothetical protein